MKWLQASLDMPEWKYDPKNSMAIDIIQPNGKSALEAYYVWNGQPVLMHCHRMTLMVQSERLDGAEGVRCIVLPTGDVNPDFYDPVFYFDKFQRIDDLERMIRDFCAHSIARRYGVDMQKYSLLQLKIVGDAMLRGYRMGREREERKERVY